MTTLMKGVMREPMEIMSPSSYLLCFALLRMAQATDITIFHGDELSDSLSVMLAWR